MDKICPYCQGQHLIKNGSAYGVPKWKCKDCLRQTSFKPPRGEPLWKKETAVLLYTLSMNAIAKQLGVSTPSILNWILRQRTRRALNRSRARAWLSWNWTSSGISFKKKEQAVDLVGF
jgi:transposase-like protein